MNNYFRFEKKENDFPFYNDVPDAVAGWKWLVMLLFPFLGLLFLIMVYIPGLSSYMNELVSGIVLLLSGLLGLKLTVGKNWRLLFRKIHWRDIQLVIGYVLAAVLIASIIGGIVELVAGPLTDNPLTTKYGDKNALREYFMLRFQEIFQLFGEEFLAVLPFLAILHFMTVKLNVNRKTVIIIAWITSSIIFGLLHLSTYNWNIIQCIFVIGGSRLLLTLSYIQTKNIWVSYFVHYFYDMLVFTVAFLS